MAARKLPSTRAILSGDYDRDIFEGMARAMYVSDWANRQEEKGISLRGELMDQAPATSPDARAAAKVLTQDFLKANKVKSLTDLYAMALNAGASGRKSDAGTFGHYLAMQAMGHGVSWFDDHPEFPLAVPSFEYYSGRGRVAQKLGRSSGYDPNQPRKDWFGDRVVTVAMLQSLHAKATAAGDREAARAAEFILHDYKAPYASAFIPQRVLAGLDRYGIVPEGRSAGAAPVADWLVKKVELSQRSVFHVSGENLNFAKGHMDRAFYWNVEDLDDPRYDLSSASFSKPALEKYMRMLTKGKIKRPLPSQVHGHVAGFEIMTHLLAAAAGYGVARVIESPEEARALALRGRDRLAAEGRRASASARKLAGRAAGREHSYYVGIKINGEVYDHPVRASSEGEARRTGADLLRQKYGKAVPPYSDPRWVVTNTGSAGRAAGKKRSRMPRVFVSGSTTPSGKVSHTYCPDCIPAALRKKLGEDYVDTWLEGSDGWTRAPKCEVCGKKIDVELGSAGSAAGKKGTFVPVSSSKRKPASKANKVEGPYRPHRDSDTYAYGGLRGEITTSYTALEKVLGKPMPSEGDGDKVTTAWRFVDTTDPTKQFWIYDWKVGRSRERDGLTKAVIRSRHILDWHIGSGAHPKDVAVFADWLAEQTGGSLNMSPGRAAGRAAGSMPAAVREVAKTAVRSATEAGMTPEQANKRVYVTQEDDTRLRVADGPDGIITLRRPWSINDNYESVKMTLYFDGKHWYAHVWYREIAKKISQAEAEANAALFFHG